MKSEKHIKGKMIYLLNKWAFQNDDGAYCLATQLAWVLDMSSDEYHELTEAFLAASAINDVKKGDPVNIRIHDGQIAATVDEIIKSEG